MSLKEALNILQMEWQIMRYQLLRKKTADQLAKMAQFLYRDFESTEGRRKKRDIYEIVKKGCEALDKSQWWGRGMDWPQD